jgi:hypothetical protein
VSEVRVKVRIAVEGAKPRGFEVVVDDPGEGAEYCATTIVVAAAMRNFATDLLEAIAEADEWSRVPVGHEHGREMVN